jgi:hypothetical protein
VPRERGIRPAQNHTKTIVSPIFRPLAGKGFRMQPDYELAAAQAINAELAKGYDSLTVEECELRYGAAFAALVSVLKRPPEA